MEATTPTKPLDVEMPERIWFCDYEDGSWSVVGESELDELKSSWYAKSSPAASTVREALVETVKHQKFLTRFWLDCVAAAIEFPNTSVRVAGEHFTIHADDGGPQVFRGFNGRRFRIRFNDGREVTTSNLWCQGTIPVEFRKLLSDNAVFLPVE